MGTTDNAAANSAVQNLQNKTTSPLSGSVGFGGDNKSDDVLKVSQALVANGRLNRPTSEATDAFNSKIITAQQDMGNSLRPDGLVKPGGPTEQKFTHLVYGGMMKAPTVSTPKNRVAAGTRAGNAAVTAANKSADVNAARAKALQHAGDTTRTSFQQAQDVKRLNNAKADASAAKARAERQEIKSREKAQHDQIMAAQKAHQQAAKQAQTQPKQVKAFANTLAQNIGNLLQDRASPDRTQTIPVIPDLIRDPSEKVEKLGPGFPGPAREPGRRDDNKSGASIPPITDEVFAANRRSAQYLASRTDMDEFPRWEIEDITTQGASAIAKTADLIEQTHDLAPDQSKRLYEQVIIGINPDAQEKLYEMLGQKPLGTQWGLVNHDRGMVNQAGSAPEPVERPLYAKERKQRRDTTSEKSTETRLNLKEGFLRGGAEVGDVIGLDRSAEYLRHFLDGSGKDIVVPRDEARKDPFINQGEKKNQEEFETKTFLGKTGKPEFNRRLRNIKDDQVIILEDYWDKALPFDTTGKKYIGNQLARVLEPDRLLSLGSLDMRSQLKGTASRTGDTIQIEGTVIHDASDDYDFKDDDESFGAYEIQQSGRGKPFKVVQIWRQKVKGSVKITEESENGELTLSNPKFSWIDEE